MKSQLAAPAGLHDKQDNEKVHDYEVKDAADTLMRAEDIKKDKRLMPHVHKHMKKMVKKIRSIQDLRDAAKASRKMEMDSEED